MWEEFPCKTTETFLPSDKASPVFNQCHFDFWVRGLDTGLLLPWWGFEILH